MDRESLQGRYGLLVIENMTRKSIELRPAKEPLDHDPLISSAKQPLIASLTLGPGWNFEATVFMMWRSPWVQPEAGVGDHAIQRNTRCLILINQCQPVTWFFTGCLPQNQLQNDHQLWVKLLDMMLPHNHNKLPPGSCSRLKIIDQVWSSYEVTK